MTDRSIYLIDPEKHSFWWNTNGPKKLAMFDFDNTLVQQKSSRKFPSSADDWKPLFGENVIKNKLEQLDKEGYIIVIVSNQGGVQKKKVSLDDMKDRFKNFMEYVCVPVYVMASIKYDHCRKPCTGIFDFIMKDVNYGGWCKDEIDVKNSFYVGDAAGRVKGWDKNDDKRSDFSCSDRKFAYNCGLQFYTPEQYFLEKDPTDKWEWGGIESENVIINRGGLTNPELKPRDKPEMIILVGCAASGKSSLCKLFPTYLRVNMDTLNSKGKCLKQAKLAAENGISLIIDNTNPDPETRKAYTDIAKKYNYYVRAINVVCPKQIAYHLNQMRMEMSSGTREAVPMIAYNIYFKKYVKPSTTEEDIDEVIDYEWIPKFEDDCQEKMFKKRY